MKRLIYTFSISLSLIFTGLFIQSCSNEVNIFNEEKDAFTLDDSEYLDLLSYEDAIFSDDDETGILAKAYQRIEKYLVITDDTCYLTIHSANEANMSDRLFSLVEDGIANVNMRYKAYVLMKGNNMDLTIRNPFEMNFSSPRLKSGSETSSSYGVGWSSTTTYLSHQDVTTVINAMRTANGNVATFGSIVAGALSGSVASALVGVYGYLNDSRFSKIQDDYAKSGSTSGMTLKEVTTYSPTTGISFTNYSVY
ncbi:MAG: hypothetical protein LBT43_19350 [Prevotella sp.]|jgi:hypothetical protein|nr:hypothetical protein [Prevotella sp.]